MYKILLTRGDGEQIKRHNEAKWYQYTFNVSKNWEIYKECKRKILKLGLMLNYIHLKKTAIFATGLHKPTWRCLRMHFALKLLQSHCLDLPKQNLLGGK